MKNGHRHFQVGHPDQPRYTQKGANRRMRKQMRKATDATLRRVLAGSLASFGQYKFLDFLKRKEA